MSLTVLSLLHDQGNLDMKCGNITAAIDKYKSGHNLANEVNPTHPITGIQLYSLGAVQLGRGQYAEAEYVHPPDDLHHTPIQS